MQDQTNIWPKHITVDKRIVKILSNSTYTNFPSAIREIITNSYDADAQNVWVDIDLKKEIISIRDDGNGMSESDFGFYLRIAGKSRKKDSELTKGKRRIVGQFGVGFLSALPFCQRYLIETKRKNTDQVVQATIVSTEYINESSKTVDVEEIPIYGKTKTDKSEYAEQYTRIRLVGFSKLTKSFFNGEYTVGNRRNTINNFAPLELFKWQLCEYLPINYDSKNKIGNRLNKIFASKATIPFQVFLDEEPLYRNIHAQNILEISENEQQIGQVKFKFAVLTNYDPIVPSEARYLMIRNLNVGVGDRTTFDLGLDGKVYAKLAHLTGEVNVIDGLNDLISVSRDKFNFSSDYEKLKEFLRKKMASWANELDSLSSFQKKIQELDDKHNVHNIDSLRLEKVNDEIESLVSKGYHIKKTTESKDTGIVKLNRAGKELIISKNFDDFTKQITVLNKSYKLSLSKWDYNKDAFPAVKLEKGKIIVNENYPLFKVPNQFDTFLKFHILFLEYLQTNKISKSAYNAMISDVLTVFNR